MKNCVSFIFLTILLNWTASFAQVGDPTQDTIRCYGLGELRQIAANTVRLQTCDSLLYVLDAKLETKDRLILLSEQENMILESKVASLERIISVKDSRISGLEQDLYKEKRRNLRLKRGLSAVLAVFGGTVTGFLIFR